MELPKRKNTRLKNYDYSTPGVYFVTICTKNKAHLLGTIKNGEMNFSGIGEFADKEILQIEKFYGNVSIDKYVVMPNHIHMIILISEGMNPFPTKKCDISNIVGKFKAAVSRSVGNAFMHSVKNTLWQASFHDHIIRGDEDYNKIWQYIDTNVLQWEQDCFYAE